MDLAKIISELRVELQAVEAAIASMETLARTQLAPPAAVRRTAPAPVVKKRRGRPRKKKAAQTPVAEMAEDSRPEAPVDISTPAASSPA